MRLHGILIMAAVGTIAPNLNADAAPTKLGVAILHSGDDSVGSQLAFAVREAIRRSAAYELGTERNALLNISIISLDPDEDKSSRGIWTAAAVVFTMRNYLPLKKGEPQTWYPIYLTATVVTVGTRGVEDSARGILASLDAAVEKFKADTQQD